MSAVPPVKIAVGFLEGVTQRKDAVAYARGYIEHHFDVPSLSGYYVMPFANGYLYEAHEGGSRQAYLPGIAKAFQNRPDGTVSVRAGKQVIQISRSVQGRFHTVLLPEELSSYLENVIDPDNVRSTLTPYILPGLDWLIAGSITACAGAVLFAVGLGFFSFGGGRQSGLSVLSPEARAPLAAFENQVQQLEGNQAATGLKFQNGEFILMTGRDVPPPVNNGAAVTIMPVPVQENDGLVLPAPAPTPPAGKAP